LLGFDIAMAAPNRVVEQLYSGARGGCHERRGDRHRLVTWITTESRRIAMKPTTWGRWAMGLVMAMGVAGAVHAADPAPPQPAAAATLTDFKRWVIASDYSRDGSLLVTAGGESLLYRPGDVVVWKVADGSRVGDLAGHPTAVWAVKVSADGKLAATAGYDGLVKLWDLQARTLKHDLKKHKGWVRSLAFSPDGTRLASAGEDGTVVLWDTATGAEVKSVEPRSPPVAATNS
jgi:hypothetical protein